MTSTIIGYLPIILVIIIVEFQELPIISMYSQILPQNMKLVWKQVCRY